MEIHLNLEKMVYFLIGWSNAAVLRENVFSSQDNKLSLLLLVFIVAQVAVLCSSCYIQH